MLGIDGMLGIEGMLGTLHAAKPNIADKVKMPMHTACEDL